MDSSAGGVWVEDMGFQKFLGTREYYKLIQKKKEDQMTKQDPPLASGKGNDESSDSQQESSQQSDSNQDSSVQSNQQPGNELQLNATSSQQKGNNQSAEDKAMDSIPKPFDDHSLWPKCDTQEEVESMTQIVESLISFAAEETEKNNGTVPGEMKGLVERIRKKPRPVTDWKRYFRRYLGNEYTELIRKSKKHESKRFPDAAGNRHQRKSHILVAIDTSGSVSMPEYREFFGQIKTLCDRATFHVVECDARIQHEYDFKNIIPETLHGGGGTNFQPVIDLFRNNKKKYDCLVYFTDGGASIPKNTPKETLWVISSRGDHRKDRYTINGASAVFIKSNN